MGLELWVLLALLGGTFQTARNGLARSVAGRLSPLLISWSRFAFNLPFCTILLVVLAPRLGWPILTLPFWLWAIATALTQLVANVLLIAAFRRSTFARSIVFHKLEVVLAALVGIALFSERPSLLGWLGVLACGAGTLIINLAGSTDVHPLRRAFWLDAGGWLSIGSGVLLVITGFTLKDATASLLAANPDLAQHRFAAAVHVLFHTVWIEVVVLSAALWLVRRHEIRQIPRFALRLLPIGLTGLCASLCWFWAYPLSLVAYVKAVGQIEGAFSVVLSLLLWKEREVWRQLPGVALMMVGIVLVLLR